MEASVHDMARFREREGVFRNREDAGQVLAEMLGQRDTDHALVVAVPSGGVPVAVEIAKALALALEVAVVCKILLPWNTEAGFGAVGFDGSVWINEEYVAYYGLEKTAVDQQTRVAREKVRRRTYLFRGDRKWPDLTGRTIILVDDGIAAGSTIRVAIRALRNIGAGKIIVAVPTAHWEALSDIVREVDELYCANIRSGRQFAVAAAYQYWNDVDEKEAKKLIDSLKP